MNAQERWQTIPDCPNYEVSDLGRVYSTRFGRCLEGGCSRDGRIKVNLTNENGIKITRYVARLVAEAFVDPPDIPHITQRHQCDQVIVLDGDFTNLSAENLAWRPRWMAWQYNRQLITSQPPHFRNLRVINLRTGIEYDSIIEAGMSLGLLFRQIWRSTYKHEHVFPYVDEFEVIGENYA